MPAISLEPDPDLGQLRKKARELQRAVRSGDPDALALVAEFHPGSPPDATFRLSAAQLVLARRYGFASWPRLRRHVEILASGSWEPARPGPGDDRPAAFLRLSCGGYKLPLEEGADLASGWERRPRVGPDLASARDLLAANPGLPAASLAVAAACADAGAVARHLAADPPAARRGSGPYGWPPLLYLAWARHDPHAGTGATLQTARLLLSAGADPNDGRFRRGETGGRSPHTALGGAIESRAGGDAAQHARALALARLLLEAGADPDDGSAGMLDGRDDDDLLELLLQSGLGREPNGRWRRLLGGQLTPPAAQLRLLLYFAIERDQRDRVALLARHGADLASPFTDLRQFFEAPGRWPEGIPAAVALLNGNSGLARQLAGLGAPMPEPGSPDGFAAAVMTGDAAAVRSADPEVVTAVRAFWPGLPVWAAGRGAPESVPLLVEAGFDVNALGRSDAPYTQQRRHSALHVAAGNGDLALARRLLDLGADPGIRRPVADTRAGGSRQLELPDREPTPLDWARREGHRELIDLLEPLTPGR